MALTVDSQFPFSVWESFRDRVATGHKMGKQGPRWRDKEGRRWVEGGELGGRERETHGLSDTCRCGSLPASFLPASDFMLSSAWPDSAHSAHSTTHFTTPSTTHSTSNNNPDQASSGEYRKLATPPSASSPTFYRIFFLIWRQERKQR